MLFVVLFLLYCSFLDRAVCCPLENVIDSDIEQDTTLGSFSEWCVTKSIVVNSGTKLTIEKGVKIIISPFCSIVSYGVIVAKGEGNDIVTFTALQKSEDLSKNWGYISLTGYQDEISNVLFEYGGNSNGVSGTKVDWRFQNRVGGMVRVGGSSTSPMKFSSVTFSKSRFLGLFANYGTSYYAGVEIESCHFLGNGYGGMYGYSESVKNSNFENNGWRCNSFPDNRESWCSHALSLYSRCRSTSICGSSSNGVVIQSNTFKNNKGALAIFEISSMQITVMSNHFEGNSVDVDSCGYSHSEFYEERERICSVLNVVGSLYSTNNRMSSFKTNSFWNNSSPEYVLDFWYSNTYLEVSGLSFRLNNAGIRFTNDVKFISSQAINDNFLKGDNRSLIMFEQGCSAFQNNIIYRNAGCSTCSVVKIKSLNGIYPTSWEIDSNYLANPMFQYEIETADLFTSQFNPSSSTTNGVLSKTFDLEHNWWGYTNPEAVSERVKDFRNDGGLFLSHYDEVVTHGNIGAPDCGENNYCFPPRTKCVVNQDKGGVVTCECEDGYYPPRKCTEFDCSELGNCGGESRGFCVSPNKCECKSPYYGEKCAEKAQMNCPGKIEGTDVQCSGHGVCEHLEESGDDFCLCIDGFQALVDCSTTSCFGIVSSNNQVCSGHGECILLDQCKCAYPFVGEKCEKRHDSMDYTCFGLPVNSTSVCSSNGICVAQDHCQCHSEYTGENCDHFGKNVVEQESEGSSLSIVIVFLLLVLIFFACVISFCCCCGCGCGIIVVFGISVYYGNISKGYSFTKIKDYDDDGGGEMTIDTDLPSINSGEGPQDSFQDEYEVNI